MWYSWQPPGRLTDDELAELRLDIDTCHRALEEVKDIITVELRRRDDDSSSRDDSWLYSD